MSDEGGSTPVTLTQEEYDDFKTISTAFRAWALLGKSGKILIWIVMTLATVIQSMKYLGIYPVSTPPGFP